MRAARQQLSVTRKITELRRSVEALLPYVQHQPGCDAALGSNTRCTCGLHARATVARMLCEPNSPPPTYTPRKYG